MQKLQKDMFFWKDQRNLCLFATKKLEMLSPPIKTRTCRKNTWKKQAGGGIKSVESKHTPRKLTYPLKINGWKMIHFLSWGGTFAHFFGGRYLPLFTNTCDLPFVLKREKNRNGNRSTAGHREREHSSESEAKSTPSSARSSSSSFTPVESSRRGFSFNDGGFSPLKKVHLFTPVFFHTCFFRFFLGNKVFFRVSFGLPVVDVQNVFF